MNRGKFETMALDSAMVALPEGLKRSASSAIVISPQGSMMCWEDNNIRTSHASRLSGVHRPLAGREDGWYLYSRSMVEGEVIGPFDPRNNEVASYKGDLPPVAAGDFSADTLADCNRRAAHDFLFLPGHDPHGTYTPETVEFVRRHLGIDPRTIDWDAAAGHRFANFQFANTAAFTPAPARAALQQAIKRAIPGEPAPAHLSATRKPARTVTQRRLPPGGTPR